MTNENRFQPRPAICRVFGPLSLGAVACIVCLGALSYGAFLPAIKTKIAVSRLRKAEHPFARKSPHVLERDVLARGHNADVAVAIALEAAAGTWSIDPWPSVSLPLEELWQGTAVDNDTWQFKLHSLLNLYDLLIAHQDRGNTEFLETGKRIIYSWGRSNPRSEPPCRFSWNDHSTANRAIAVCAFADYCAQQGLLDAEFESFVAELLFEHGRFLSDPRNYTSFHNHGIFQDYALIVVATHLNTGSLADAWVDQARRRLREQVVWAYSANGIHLENSPRYHLLVTQLVRRVVNYMAAVGLAVPEAVQATVALAETEAPNLVMPNGCVVPVGDSRRNLQAQISHHDGAETFVVYPEAGYAVVQGSPYLFFAASNRSPVHKHCDDLSCLVGDDAGLILTDVGLLNYECDDSERDFSLSWAAHNTVVAESTGPGERSKLCGIESYGHADSCVFIQGRSIREDGTEHLRAVLYDRVDRFTLVIDECRSPSPVKWNRFFHFETNVCVQFCAEGQLRIEREGLPVFTMAFWPDAAERDAVIAQREPLQGWVAEAYQGLVAAPATVETVAGQHVVLAAAIMPGNETASIRIENRDRIEIETERWNKVVVDEPEWIEVTTRRRQEKGGAEESESTRIPLTRVEVQPCAYATETPPAPCGLKRRIQLVTLNIAGWTTVLILLATTRLRSSWKGIVTVLVCAALNAQAIVMVWPRLG